MTLPSVTAILAACGLGGDFSRVPPEALEIARKRGTAVHAAIEGRHYGYETDLPAECSLYLTAYDKFAATTEHQPIVSEFLVESARWRYCGHPDRLAWMHGHRCLFDWKTGQIDLDSVKLQLCGYELAWNEQHPKEPIDTCYAVQLRADGTYGLHPILTKPAMNIWQAAVIVYHERVRRGAINGA